MSDGSINVSLAGYLPSTDATDDLTGVLGINNTGWVERQRTSRISLTCFYGEDLAGTLVVELSNDFYSNIFADTAQAITAITMTIPSSSYPDSQILQLDSGAMFWRARWTYGSGTGNLQIQATDSTPG